MLLLYLLIAAALEHLGRVRCRQLTAQVEACIVSRIKVSFGAFNHQPQVQLSGFIVYYLESTLRYRWDDPCLSLHWLIVSWHRKIDGGLASIDSISRVEWRLMLGVGCLKLSHGQAIDQICFICQASLIDLLGRLTDFPLPLLGVFLGWLLLLLQLLYQLQRGMGLTHWEALVDLCLLCNT